MKNGTLLTCVLSQTCSLESTLHLSFELESFNRLASFQSLDGFHVKRLQYALSIIGFEFKLSLSGPHANGLKSIHWLVINTPFFGSTHAPHPLPVPFLFHFISHFVYVIFYVDEITFNSLLKKHTKLLEHKIRGGQLSRMHTVESNNPKQND